MKKLVSILLVLLMVLGLTACSGNGGNGGNTSDGPVTVTIWNHTFTEGQLETFNEIIDAFNAENEGKITVVMENQERNGFDEKVYNAVASGTGPDIIMNFATTAATYVDPSSEEGTLVVDMSKYTEGTYNASTVDSYVYDEMVSFEDGGMHIMPMAITGPIVFYDATVLSELGYDSFPTTWEGVYEMAKKAREEKDVYGFAFDSLVDSYQSFAKQDGLNVIDTASKTTDINNADFEAQLAWLREGGEKQYFMLESSDYFSNEMSNGALAAYVGSSAGLPYINLPEGHELGCAPFPVWEGKTPWVVAWERSFIVFKSDEAREAAAVKFVEYFVNTENNAKWCQSVNGLSPYTATQGLADYKTFVEGNVALNALNEQSSYSGLFPAVTGSSAVRSAIQTAVQKAMTGESSPADALVEAENACNNALQGK